MAKTIVKTLARFAVAAGLALSPSAWAAEAKLAVQCGSGGVAEEIQWNEKKFGLPRPAVVSLAKRVNLAREQMVADVCARTDDCLEKRSLLPESNQRDRSMIGFLAFGVYQALERMGPGPESSDVDWSKVGETAESASDYLKTRGSEKVAQLKLNLRSQDRQEAALALAKLRKILATCDMHAPKETKVKAPSISLSYDLPGINRNKSGRYRTAELQNIIEHALNENVDPFLAMSIVMLEDPPFEGDSTRYDDRYGPIPVDAIGAYDLIGCANRKESRSAPKIEPARLKKIRDLKNRLDESERVITRAEEKFGQDYALVLVEAEGASPEKSKAGRMIELRRDPFFRTAVKAVVASDKDRKAYDEIVDALSDEDQRQLQCMAGAKECHGLLVEQKSVPRFDLTGLTKVSSMHESAVRFCSSDTRMIVGAHPNFDTSEDVPDATEEKPSETQCCVDVTSHLSPDDAGKEMLAALGSKFISKKIQSCLGHDSLESCIQKYNGVGCFGCTEQMKNNCYDGIVGADRPIYGARAADLMVNTLMKSPDIQELVKDASKRMGRSVQSAFCADGKAGRRIVETDTYLQLQRRYLLEGDKHDYKGRFGNSLRAPATAEERRIYVQREQDRAKACGVHFQRPSVR